MILTRLYTLKDLLPLYPSLIAEKQRENSAWETDLSTATFVTELATYIDRDDSLFFGELRGDKLLYFAAIINVKSNEPLFWLLYVDKTFREHTTELIEEIHKELKTFGVSKMYFITSRLESSYERWLKKFGAKKHKIVYLLEEQ